MRASVDSSGPNVIRPRITLGLPVPVERGIVPNCLPRVDIEEMAGNVTPMKRQSDEHSKAEPSSLENSITPMTSSRHLPLQRYVDVSRGLRS